MATNVVSNTAGPTSRTTATALAKWSASVRSFTDHGEQEPEDRDPASPMKIDAGDQL